MTRRLPHSSDARTLLSVCVHPGAHGNRHRWSEDDVLHVWVTAAAVDGAANRAVTKYLANVLGLPQIRITLERGAASRTKRFCVEGTQVVVIQALSETPEK